MKFINIYQDIEELREQQPTKKDINKKPPPFDLDSSPNDDIEDEKEIREKPTPTKNKSMNVDTRYFNFPVQFLEGFVSDKDAVLENIFDYALYVKTKSFKSKVELKNGEAAEEYFGVKSENLSISLEVGKLLSNAFPPKSPKVGLNKATWLQYYQQEKTEFENITLLAYLALRSILGRKPYCKVVNLFWLARMDGKPRSVMSVSELSASIHKFSNEYQITKIKKELEDSWHLVSYSKHFRGFYVSFKLTKEKLIDMVDHYRDVNNKTHLRIKTTTSKRLND